MVDKYNNLGKDEWIAMLECMDTKNTAYAYLEVFPAMFIKNFTKEELYDIMVKVKKQSIVRSLIYNILQTDDYYLFLAKNKKEKKLSKRSIEKYIQDILYKNNNLIKNGKGDLIENTILYGLEINHVIDNIDSICDTIFESVWLTFLDEIEKNKPLFLYLECIAPRLIEKVLSKKRIFQFVKKMKTCGYEKIGKENEDVLIARLTNIDIYTLEDERLLLPLKILIRELLEKTNETLENIEYIGSGGFSNTYRIGPLILKNGKGKVKRKMPNHPRFLKPFLRKELMKDKFLEVYKCAPGSALITKETVYQIYKELREDGIIWFDPKISNLGILLEDNDTKIHGEEIHIKDESIQFYGTTSSKIYQKGDVVIRDVDTAVYVEDFSIAYYESEGMDLTNYKEMEHRYQIEQIRASIKR